MTRRNAIQSFMTYAENHNMHVTPTIGKNDDGSTSNCYTMQYRADAAPHGFVESSIWFHDDSAEIRVYYNAYAAEICRKSEYIHALLQLLNFINARVFLGCGDPDGMYEPHMLYTPRMYLTVDGCYDLTITTIIPYDFWEVAPVETLDYMTCYCPELLDRLAYPVFGILKGDITIEEAIGYINDDILTFLSHS